MIPTLVKFAEANDIHCFTALVVQLDNNFLVDWAQIARRTADFWLCYFDKWTQHCEGCEPTTGEFLAGLDWSV